MCFPHIPSLIYIYQHTAAMFANTDTCLSAHGNNLSTYHLLMAEVLHPAGSDNQTIPDIPDP